MTLHLIIGRYAFIMLVIWTATAFYLNDKVKPEARDEKVDYRYWIRSGQERLHFEIRRQQEAARSTGKVAKNVILFIGDGMGMSTITATRIYKNQLAGGYGEENELSFEQFPFVGLAKTYEVDSQVTKHRRVYCVLISLRKVNQFSLF
jgi:alkaline phosphatase